MNLHHFKVDKSWSLFLDRDGVINRRIVDGYVQKWEQLELLPGVPDALMQFNRVFGRIVVVSNQQGVGKGLMTDADVETIHARLMTEIEHAGGRIDAVFYAPNLRSDNSILRKPGIGMALKARRKFPEIRFNHSIMVGDSVSDMVFGKRLGMKTILITSDAIQARIHHRLVDFICPDLITFANAL